MKLKVLMIGNSFSICVGKNLPQIVRAGKKHQLELTSTYIIHMHKHLFSAERIKHRYIIHRDSLVVQW